MPKPIIVLKVETHVYNHDYDRLLSYEKAITQRFEKDYYVIAVPLLCETEEPVRLEAHYDKNFNDTKFSQLKEFIANMMKHPDGEKIEINRDTVVQLLKEHPPMLTNTQIDMWKAYGSYDKFALNPGWNWNMDKLNSMDGYQLLKLHNEIESFK